VTAPFHAAHAPDAAHAVSGAAATEAAHGGHGLMYLSALIALAGITVAYALYVRRPWIPHLLRSTMPQAYYVLHNKYFVDEGYDKAVVKPLRTTGVACFRIDEFIIDGIIWLVTAVPRLFGAMARAFQRGALQGYGLTMAAGLGIIILLVLFR
jgi:NADH-quinone oxidoreductase subunit L